MNNNMFFPNFLGLGTTGDAKAVRLLQIMLMFAGCRNEIFIDGIFNEEMELGVKRLQHELGLPKNQQNGIFGELTKNALKTERNCDINSICIDCFAVKLDILKRDTFFPDSLSEVSGKKEYAAIKLLQIMLMFAGYNNNLLVSGNYGPETVIGVTRLQLSLGVDVKDCNGRFGLITRGPLSQSVVSTSMGYR